MQVDDIYSDNDSDGQKSSKRIKQDVSKQGKHRKQIFSEKWLQNPKFANWLRPDKNSKTSAKCITCNVTIGTEMASLNRHLHSKKHNLSSNSVSKTPSVMESFSPKFTPLIQKVKSAEIKLVAFVAEHNIPFLAMDHLSELIKNLDPESEVLKNIQLKRTKSTSIMKNVIGRTHKEYLVGCLINTKFSILTDESTDISCVKQACIVVRYFNRDIGKIVSHFFDLANIFDPNNHEVAYEGATGKNLYNCLIKAFNDCNIPSDNIIGFGSDGCNSMMGANNSVASRMIQNFPGISIWTCICHSLHLCASEACKILPKRCEDLARQVYSFFSMSSKRSAQFVEFQEFCSTPIHKLLHPSQTRWLSLHMVVSRLLEQWDPLILYFRDKLLSERLITLENIYNSLNDPLIKLIYMFLDFVLPKFTSLNSFFQSSSVVITQLHDKVVGTFKELLICFMDPNYVNKTLINEINPENSQHYLPFTQIYLGIKIMKEVQKPKIANNKKMLDDFYSRVQSFLKIACMQLKKKYNFNDPLMPAIKLMDPKIALSIETRKENSSIFFLLNLLPRLTKLNDDLMQCIDDEWRRLPHFNIPTDLLNYLDQPDIFWYNLSKLQLGNKEFPFINLSNFALDVFVLPHSNADCERVFSKVNLIKVKTRNKLNTDTIQGCLFASQEMKIKNNNCVNYIPPQKMIDLMNTNNLYNKNHNDEFSFEQI